MDEGEVERGARRAEGRICAGYRAERIEIGEFIRHRLNGTLYFAVLAYGVRSYIHEVAVLYSEVFGVAGEGGEVFALYAVAEVVAVVALDVGLNEQNVEYVAVCGTDGYGVAAHDESIYHFAAVDAAGEGIFRAREGYALFALERSRHHAGAVGPLLFARLAAGQPLFIVGREYLLFARLGDEISGLVHARKEVLFGIVFKVYAAAEEGKSCAGCAAFALVCDGVAIAVDFKRFAFGVYILRRERRADVGGHRRARGALVAAVHVYRAAVYEIRRHELVLVVNYHEVHTCDAFVAEVERRYGAVGAARRDARLVVRLPAEVAVLIERGRDDVICRGSSLLVPRAAEHR